MFTRNDKATVHIGNVPMEADEDIIHELALQFGLVHGVSMPRDKITGQREDYCFVEFQTTDDAKYFADVAGRSAVSLYGRQIRVSYKGTDQIGDGLLEIGAKLCVRGLDPAVDENMLNSHFSQFGKLAVPPKVVRDENAVSKGIGIISFQSFEASDAALKAADGSFFANRQISVAYADRADGRGKHGSDEERKHFKEGQLAVNQPTTPAQSAAPLPMVQPAWASGLNPFGKY